MINALKNLFGLGETVDFAQVIKQGAIILDVRSEGEYSIGHIKGSINIPVEELRGSLKKLKGKEHPIITCCASGMRSSSAKSILQQEGYTNVFNGGSWRSLTQYFNG